MRKEGTGRVINPFLVNLSPNGYEDQPPCSRLTFSLLHAVLGDVGEFHLVPRRS